jgi:AraC-like DNA-binding protein
MALNRAFDEHLSLLKILASARETLRQYSDLTCHLVVGEGLDAWVNISESSTHNWLISFETRFGQGKLRRPYNRACFDKVCRSRKAYLGTHCGFQDLFVPVLDQGKVAGVFVMGPFARKMPSLEMLKAQWRQRTGVDPNPGSRDFLEYQEAALRTPVLDEEMLPRHRRLLEDLAGLMAGRLAIKQGAALMDRDRQEGFVGRLPRKDWVRSVVDRHGAFGISGSLLMQGVLADWEKAELGISQPPQVALMVAPDAGDRPQDAAFLERRLQRECARIARDLPETVAEGMEHGLTLFLAALPPGLERPKWRGHLAGLARSLAAAAHGLLGVPVRIGIGEHVEDCGSLEASALGAERALQCCAFQELSPVFYEDQMPPQGQDPLLRLAEASRALRQAFGRGTGLQGACDEYLRAVLMATAEHPVAVRAHLSAMAAQLVDALETRHPGGLEGMESLAQSWNESLAKCRSTAELALEFRRLTQAWGQLLRATPGRRNDIAIARVVQHLERHYDQPLSLALVAKRLGLSANATGRCFKQHTGMGFSEYLQKVRFEQACRMLRETRRSIGRISMECGFNSPSYFTRSFIKFAQRSPLAYRQGQGSLAPAVGPAGMEQHAQHGA